MVTSPISKGAFILLHLCIHKEAIFTSKDKDSNIVIEPNATPKRKNSKVVFMDYPLEV